MRLPWRRAAVERTAWLADDTLLTVGWCLAPLGALTARLVSGGESRPVQARWCAYPRLDVEGPDGAGRVAVFRFSSPLDRYRSGKLVIGAGGTEWTLATRRLQRSNTSARDAIAFGVGWLDPNTRRNILGFLTETLDQPSDSALQIAQSLAELRDALRPALPEYPVDRGEICCARLEFAMRLDDRSFYVRGWAYTPTSSPARLTVVSPEGHQADVLDAAFRFRRDDIDAFYQSNSGACGFVAYAELPRPSLVREGWIAELAVKDGFACQSARCAVTAMTADAARDTLLGDVNLDRSMRGGLIEHHIYPAMRRLSGFTDDDGLISEVAQYGAAVATPDVSIIVPQYRRLDLMEQQIAQLALDDQMRGAELIYVLDSPELADEFRERARQLHELYKLGFRTIVLARNVGFARANNAAASMATGRLLVLLNSDVFPAEPGWLAQMRSFYDSTERAGALGVKLLYEDDTLQHAGMYFRREPDTHIWENQHYFKGLERTFPAANVARAVPAVTGACLMMSRQLFLDQGGLRGLYVRGDYEDSDLCLRLLAAGYENWYLPTVEMYHLEGQSYGWTERSGASTYNAWMHTRLWDDAIEQTMTRYGPAIAP